MLKRRGLLDGVIANFSRTVSIDLFFPVGYTSIYNLNPVDRLARVLVVPGSIRQLEEDKEDRKLESSKDPRSTHTLCFWFHQFKVKERKTNSILDYARASSENLHCFSLVDDTGLMLNFDYKGALGEFQKSIQLVWNPKMIGTYQLSMTLKNLRSLEELTRFVQVELQNPTAKLVKHHQEVLNPCEPSGAWYYFQKIFPRSFKTCDQRDEIVVFQSEIPFSNETMNFRLEACKSHGWKEKNGLFSVVIKFGWDDNDTPPLGELFFHCSIQIETKVQRNFLVDTELSLSYLEPVQNQESLN